MSPAEFKDEMIVFEQRIKQLYADIAPLQREYGIKSMTLEERATRWEKNQQLLKSIRPAPKWKI